MLSVPGLRRALLDAVVAGEQAGRDPTTPPTACPYPPGSIERRAWVRGFGRGRVLAKVAAPSEVGEAVDEDTELDPARLVDDPAPTR